MTVTPHAFAQEATTPGFHTAVHFAGLSYPVAVRFSPNGQCFIAERDGRIKVFGSLYQPTPVATIDLSEDVWAFVQQGLLSIAVHPEFPKSPYLYALYSHREAPNGRLLRLTLDPATFKVVDQRVLLSAWCFTNRAHGVGDLAFGPDGALYVSAGDGADDAEADYGQLGPQNPDNDPAGPLSCSDPDLQGGSLRSLDLMTDADPLDYNGTVLRIHPLNGMALPDNPLYGSPIVGADRIVAYGLRNPYRMALRPQSNDLYLCDVGTFDYEELDRVPNTVEGPIPNFGWPCYEGPLPNAAFDALGLPLCESLYETTSATLPFWSYPHPAEGRACISAACFYNGARYPAAYKEALFVSDYKLGNITAFFADPDGVPQPATAHTVIDSGAPAVDLQIGPDGNLYFIAYDAGTLNRVYYREVGPTPSGPYDHDADQDHDGYIALAELLRVIQFYNSFAYHCAIGTEDGFAPGPGASSCAPHTSDYAPSDWSISLAELLRVIQFYNAGGYGTCADTEDGYCPV